MKKMISGIIVVIALSILYIGFVSASENQSYAVIQPITTPIENVSHELDSGVEIQNMTEYLFYWNERMDWNLSHKQISDLSNKAENQILKNLTSTDGKWYHIKNLTRFDEDLGTIIGLNGAQISAFITEQRNQLTIDHMNNDKPYQIQSPEKNGITSSISSISPGSQSAPFARGKLFYLYIITDFTIPSSEGVWIQAEMNDAINDARSGTDQIRVQAPSSGHRHLNI